MFGSKYEKKVLKSIFYAYMSVAVAVTEKKIISKVIYVYKIQMYAFIANESRMSMYI